MSPSKPRKTAMPGMAFRTRESTAGSAVKHLLSTGTPVATSAKRAATLAKFTEVFRRASARARPLGRAKMPGTNDWATWLSASTTGARQQKMEMAIWWAAMSSVPKALEATWDMVRKPETRPMEVVVTGTTKGRNFRMVDRDLTRRRGLMIEAGEWEPERNPRAGASSFGSS